MITPADLARMLGQTPDSADSHTQDHLLYTSETPHHSADSGDSSDVGGTASHSTNQAVHQDEVDAVPTAQHSGVPGTPATPATPEPSESEISDAASDMPAPKPMMPTPATVFGMHATVTIATTSGTIEGQADGIAGEAGAETIAEVEPIIATAQTSVTIVTNDPAATAHAAVAAAVAVATAAAAHTTALPTPRDEQLPPATRTAPAATPVTMPVSAPSAAPVRPATSAHPTPATVFGRHPSGDVASPEPAVPVEPVTPSGPTPAMMPQRRTSDGPTTFASLDAQELPVVREYSAGGLIFDDQNRVAIIARHSRSGHLEWCLPKGHIEKGETPQQTAVREVHEETGILGEVIDSIATIDYWFTGTTQRVHKLVHHFALKQTGGELTVEGDPDHEAEDAIWVRFEDLDDVLSYPNERKIAWLYARKKNRQANE